MLWISNANEFLALLLFINVLTMYMEHMQIFRWSHVQHSGQDVVHKAVLPTLILILAKFFYFTVL